MTFQPMHLLIIAGIALLICGPKRLAELGKGLGDGLRGFNAAMNPGAGKPGEPKTPALKKPKLIQKPKLRWGRIAGQECGSMAAGELCSFVDA